MSEAGEDLTNDNYVLPIRLHSFIPLWFTINDYGPRFYLN